MEYLNMRTTISEGVHRLLSTYPYIEEYLSNGLINFRALARHIYDDVKRDLGSDVKFQSVVTAVRRYPISKTKLGRGKVSNILAQSEVSLKYDVGVITTEFDQSVIELMEKIQSGLKSPYMVFQGIETLTVVVEEGQLESIASILRGKVLDKKDKLAFIIVKSTVEIVDTPGVIAYLGNILAMEGINLVEMMSSHTETCFIVEEGDALRTIDVIRREIKRARS
ncbi:MAG: hypothetical protein V3V92_01565 [Candidatus Hydrothermarchaeales archaeon]